MTLGDLAAEGRSLRIWCNRCGYHVPDRDSFTLALLFGSHTPAPSLSRRLWCTECGARGTRQGDVFAMPEPSPIGPLGLSRP